MLRCSLCKFKNVSSPRIILIRTIKMAFNVYGVQHIGKSIPPIIILHGLLGSKSSWHGVSLSLEKIVQRKIYTVDARNHGHSPHTIEHGSEHIAADIAELINREGYKRCCVLGHGMGGRAMMYFALKYPELTDRGIIVDTFPISSPYEFNNLKVILTMMKNMKLSKDLSLNDGRFKMEEQLRIHIQNPQTLQYVMLNLKKDSSGEFYWKANVTAIYDNLALTDPFQQKIAGLQPFTKPICFIAGRKSIQIEQDHWPGIQRIFPNSEIHWINAGHLLHYENPTKFIAIVAKFLENK